MNDNKPARIVAVIGPAGAPGRSAIAANLAVVAAKRRHRVLLLDLDLTAPSQRFIFGSSDSGSGLAASIRLIGQGRIDEPKFAKLALPVIGTRERLRILAGTSSNNQVLELNGSHLSELLEFVAPRFDLVVIDTGVFVAASVGSSPLIRQILAASSAAILVASQTPTGIHRFIEAAKALPQLHPPPTLAVLNRYRDSLHSIREINQTTQNLAGVEIDFVVPEDRYAFDLAAIEGRPAVLATRKTPVRPALERILDALPLVDDG